MKWYNGVKIDGIEALCTYLKRFVFSCRYSDIIPRFGRDIPQLSMISILVMSFIYKNHKHCFKNLGQDLLSPLNLQLYVDSSRAREATLHNCWSFTDGTVHCMCRPQAMQRVLYNGHKRVVVINSVIWTTLYGPKPNLISHSYNTFFN